MRAFGDRASAGLALAARVRAEELHDPIVVGLARGGVVVAASVAAELRIELDALAVCKIGHPDEPEYALGAVVAGCEPVLGPKAAQDLDTAAARARAAALDADLHADHGQRRIAGRDVVLVDDGIATGATMFAAVAAMRAFGARRVVVAAPLAAARTAAALEQVADVVVALLRPDEFGAVGRYYDDFDPVELDEVVGLLRAAAADDHR